MVYVPGATFRTGTMGYSSSAYLRFKEVREQPRISFSSRDRLRSEAVSRKLAAAIVKALKKVDLPVQPYQPIRERVIRGRQVWLPAVLRGNAVPTKVLVEMVNLNNPDDAALLGRAADRERLARGLAAALAGHFGEPREHFIQEESQPDTFAFAMFAHFIHAVVPVARAHQRQAMLANSQTAIECARAMLEHRCRFR